MVQTGMVALGRNTPGWSLAIAAEGERVFVSQDIPFHVPFGRPPNVNLALCGVDSTGNHLRIHLEPIDIEEREFTIKVGTWGDSAIEACFITWIASD